MEEPFRQYYLDEKEEKTGIRVFIGLVITLMLLYAGFLVVNISFYQNYEYIIVEGTSMQPTINPDPVYKTTQNKTGLYQDGVYVSLWDDITYGDIVVIDKSKDSSIIKRVLAFGGDKVSIALISTPAGEMLKFLRVKKGTDEVVELDEGYIKSYADWTRRCKSNDHEYDNDFYKNFIYGKNTTIYEYDGKQILFATVPEGEIFFMGDNRADSLDSRGNGTFSIENVVGKVVMIARDIASSKNSAFFWANHLKGYFSIIWYEIVEKFTFPI